VYPACFQLAGMLMHTSPSSKYHVNATEQHKSTAQVLRLHAPMLRSTLTLVGTDREPASHGEGAMRKVSVQAVLLSRAVWQRGCNVAILEVPAGLQFSECSRFLCFKPWVLHAAFPMLVATFSSFATELSLCSSAMCITCASNPIHCCVQKLASRGELARKT
jgi:hypothetical protein